MLNRLAHSLPWALRHLLASVLLAALTALLVFGVWFPAPYREISGGGALFILMLGVDVICGPLLTLLLLHPSKSRKAMVVDIALIACVQIAALAYGLHTLSYARPLALVFEVDRFRVVAFADILEADLDYAPSWVRPWGFAPPQVLGTRTARTGIEKLDSVDASLQGVEPGQRPDWWQDYRLSADAAIRRSQPLVLLQQLNPSLVHHIQTAASQAALAPLDGETSSPSALRWLPLVGRQTMDWVTLIDPMSGRIRGYAHASGFSE